MADAPMTPTEPLRPHSENEVVRTTDIGTWRYLMDEPGMGIVVCDDGGRVLDANETGAELLAGRSREDYVGQRLEQAHGPELVEEILEHMVLVNRAEKRGIHRMLWGGKQLVITHHPIGRGDSGHRMLYLARHVWGPLRLIEDAMDTFYRVSSTFVDFGELDVLTDRELEVLAHIGNGKSLAQIAEVLNRSKKTIDSHRSAIGRKLRVHTRAELATRALAAGLRPSDINSRRLQTVLSAHVKKSD